MKTYFKYLCVILVVILAFGAFASIFKGSEPSDEHPGTSGQARPQTPETEAALLDRDTAGFIYFDNVTDTSFTSNGIECEFTNSGEYATVTSATDEGIGVKLVNSGKLIDQTLFNFQNHIKAYSEQGDKIVIRFKVINSGLDTMSVFVRNSSQNVKTSAEFVPTGEWQTVILEDVPKFSIWQPGEISIIFYGIVSHECEIYVDFMGTSYGHEDFEHTVAQEVAAQTALWNSIEK